jgi:hypothetical protein
LDSLPRGILWLVAAWLLTAAPSAAEEPLRLHPENPHYLLFRGEPAVLVTSGEHYGAVLNLDFDYRPYVDELESHGLNQTRTFSGAYCEPPGAFNIEGNTLAPAEGRLICPWARSTTRGYAGGGARFDLTQWDEAYFRRLKDFVAQAGRRGIVVELVLFCPFYKDEMWNLSPMKAENNVNGVGRMPRTEVYTLEHPELLAVQEAMVRKIVRELNEFDNLYYEVCNEPYFGGVTREWQDRIIRTIVETEETLPHKHLIAQNIANGSQKIENPNPAVSIFNFHYATPPTAVTVNYGLNRVIGDDETGFKGSDDVTYRREGWEFLLAGGGVYSNLDYSFTPENEDGSATPQAPGGGGEELRKQLGILKDFLHSFDFIRMKPDNRVIRGGVPKNARAWALVEPGKAYAIYLNAGGQANLTLALPAGAYDAEWLNTKTGEIDHREQVVHAGGQRTVSSPPYGEDIALRIKRSGEE